MSIFVAFTECKRWTQLQPYVKAVAQAIGDVYFDPHHNKCYCAECESTCKRREVPAAVSSATGAAALSPALLKRLQSGECGWSGDGKVQRFVQVENRDPDRIVGSEQRVPVHSRPLGWCRMGVAAPAFASDPALQVPAFFLSSVLIGMFFHCTVRSDLMPGFALAACGGVQVFSQWLKCYHGTGRDGFDASVAMVKGILSTSFLRPGMRH